MARTTIGGNVQSAAVLYKEACSDLGCQSFPEILGFVEGMILGLNRENQRAMLSFKQAAALREDFEDAWFFAGKFAARMKDSQGAMDCFSKAVGINPDFAEAYVGMGATSLFVDDSRKAIEYSKKALELFDQGIYNHHGLAGILEKATALETLCLAHIQDENLDDAIGYATKGLESLREAPNHPAVAFYRQEFGAIVEQVSIAQQRSRMATKAPLN